MVIKQKTQYIFELPDDSDVLKTFLEVENADEWKRTLTDHGCVYEKEKTVYDSKTYRH